MLPGIKLFDLTGRAAIITGGSKGLGAAMAEGLASAGANVLLVSRNLEEAQAVADEIASGYGVKTAAIVADVSNPADVDAMVAKAINEFGKIDILFNNAGINIRGPIDELSYEEFRKVQDINVDGVWLCSRAVAPHMKKQGAGNIVNMASVAGNVAIPTYPIYCATKAGIIMMTKALSVELARSGIHVNAIAPGNTETPMNVDIRTDPELKPVLDFMAMLTPSGRTYSTAEEMANVALFLASPVTGKPMHGAVITADEGFGAGLFVAS